MWLHFILTTDQTRIVCVVLVNSEILTANYSAKQNQFTKPTSKPRASDPEESNKVCDSAI